MASLLRRRKARDEVPDGKSSRTSLTLQVQIHLAKNFTINEATCSPLCLLTFNNMTKTTKRIKNTTHPVWKSTLKLKLSALPSSQYLRFIIYDTSKTNFLYLAECKISILTLFKTTASNYNFMKPAQWYPMFNRNLLREKNLSWMDPRAQNYSFGEMQLSFRLVATSNDDFDTLTKFHIWNTRLLNNIEYETMKKDINKDSMEDVLEYQDVLDQEDMLEVLGVDDPDQDIEIQMDLDYVDGEDGATDGQQHIVEEQAIIEDPEILKSIGKLYALDSISLSSETSVVTNATDTSLDSDSSDNSSYSLEENVDESLTALNEFHIYGGLDSAQTLSQDFVTPNDSTASLSQGLDGDNDEDDRKLLSRRRKRLPKRRKSLYSFEVSKKEHSLGVAVLNMKNITDLPLIKKKMAKSGFDMDPFVIITFGRRVFKTSHKKKTLCPEYNEACAFEVYPQECHFEFVFQVVDKDSFSFHDKIAKASISWRALMDKYEPGEILNLELPLQLDKFAEKHKPVISFSFQFLPYNDLKKQFWTQSLNSLTTQEYFDIIELGVLLEQIGQFTSNEIHGFFHYYDKVPWAHDKLKKDELIAYLQNWTENNKNSSPFNNIQTCPLCGKRVTRTRNVVNSKLNKENDLITHFAICQLKKDFSDLTFLNPAYVSINSASRRWYSKALIKLTYGKYALGSNNANILVQDRDSGIILEEKISAHVKLGIRIIYNGKGVRSKKFRNLLRSQTIKQGKKFDSLDSVKYIPSFIKFHSLDMSECQDVKFDTFNEFFYRKLKPGSRVPESHNPGILLSAADCRATVFPTVEKAQDIWIKGRSFTLQKLLGECDHHSLFTEHNSSIVIFRLAPQDYHRFHSPCEGTVGKVHYISGEYYTVNPMAIRTKLDVFGENVRCIIPITSPEFGTILYVAVGAMMVGSIILTCKEGDIIERGQEMGYFKFGGSTIITLIPHQKILFDSDLIKNSEEMVETLLKVGMSIGHIPSIPEHPRVKRTVHDKEEYERIKRIITVTDENVKALDSVPWEYDQLKTLSS